MKITMNTQIANTQFRAAEAINRSLHRGKETEETQGFLNRDKAVISPVGKASSMIEQLMKQKDNLLDQKNALIERATKEGGSGEGLQEQLKAIDEQMEDLDQQISQIMADQMTERAEDVIKDKKEEPMTKEEAQNQRMSQVLSASSGYEQARVMNSVKTRMEREINTLESEIHSVNGATASKKERVSELKEATKGLSEEIAGKLGETQEAVAKQTQTEIREEDEEDTTKDVNPDAAAVMTEEQEEQ